MVLKIVSFLQSALVNFLFKQSLNKDNDLFQHLELIDKIVRHATYCTQQSTTVIFQLIQIIMVHICPKLTNFDTFSVCKTYKTRNYIVLYKNRYILSNQIKNILRKYLLKKYHKSIILLMINRLDILYNQFISCSSCILSPLKCVLAVQCDIQHIQWVGHPFQ